VRERKGLERPITRDRAGRKPHLPLLSLSPWDTAGPKHKENWAETLSRKVLQGPTRPQRFQSNGGKKNTQEKRRRRVLNDWVGEKKSLYSQARGGGWEKASNGPSRADLIEGQKHPPLRGKLRTKNLWERKNGSHAKSQEQGKVTKNGHKQGGSQ